MADSKHANEVLSPTESIRLIAPYLRDDLHRALRVIVPDSIRRPEAYCRPDHSCFPTTPDHYNLAITKKLRAQGFYVISSEKPYWSQSAGDAGFLNFHFIPPNNMIEPAKRRAATVHNLREPSSDYTHSRTTLYEYIRNELDRYLHEIEPSLRVVTLGESQLFLSKIRTHPNYTDSTKEEGLDPIDSVKVFRASITKPERELQIFFENAAAEYERGFLKWASSGASRIISNLSQLLPHTYRSILLREYRRHPDVGTAFRRIPMQPGSMTSDQLKSFFKESGEKVTPFLNKDQAERIHKGKTNEYRRRRNRVYERSRSRSRSPIRTKSSPRKRSARETRSPRIKSVVTRPTSTTTTRKKRSSSSDNTEGSEERDKLIEDLQLAPESDDSDDAPVSSFIIPRKKANITPPREAVTTQPATEDKNSLSRASDRDESQATVEEATAPNRTNSPSPPLNKQDMSGFSPGIGFCIDPQAEVIRGYYTTPQDTNHSEIIREVLPEAPEIRHATPSTPTPPPVPEEDLLDYEEELAPEGDTADESANRMDSESDEVEIVQENTRDRAAYEAAFLEFWNDGDNKSYLERLIRERGAAQ